MALVFVFRHSNEEVAETDFPSCQWEEIVLIVTPLFPDMENPLLPFKPTSKLRRILKSSSALLAVILIPSHGEGYFLLVL